MNRGIKIEISGGQNPSVGTVVQGTLIQNGGGLNQQINLDQGALDAALEDLENRVTNNPETERDIKALKSDLIELKSDFENKKLFRWGSINETAKLFYEKYGWAGELIRKIFLQT